MKQNIGVLLIIAFIPIILIFFRDPEKSALILPLVYIIHLGKELFFPLLALVFANSMTDGLCIAGLFIIAPFSIAYLFNY